MISLNSFKKERLLDIIVQQKNNKWYNIARHRLMNFHQGSMNFSRFFLLLFLFFT